MNRVLVIGNATVDLILSVAELPAPGETVLADQAFRCPGGKGLNQALAASRLGVSTTLVASIGDDQDGRFLDAALAGELLAVEWVASTHPTDLSIVSIAASGENAIVSTAASARSLAPESAEAAASTLGPGDVLLLQGNLGEATTHAAHRAARAAGARTIFNTAPIAWDQRELASQVDIVVANAGEVERLTSLRNEAAALRLIEAGAGTVIVTRGAYHAILADRSGVRLFPIGPVGVVDTSGAGDVTVGILAAGLVCGLAIDKALDVALTAASLSVTRHGTSASFPTAAELSQLLLGTG
ncbi:PfkB family carbohydrate kinase [Bosea sp. NBC_00550]|uniref:PfkB family carbohydrate kinase n=1 Tax=Bosea sp. NBC_00550 TaxID=2969621 RepID=UPI00222F6713|nr:PfkB family carbohydrate kinase [Bosea sp. NBC_00550]UZF95008.1 PfkB family carbohydrate kinase [Bosea sp. NBC_00550]